MFGSNHRQAVRVKYPSGRVERHVIELLPYHVNGWVRTRCLNHGRQQPDALSADTEQGRDKTARAAAVDCGRIMQLPFGHTIVRELEPMLREQDGQWVPAGQAS